MRSASYWLSHKKTNSKVLVEFAIKDGVVCIVDVKFIFGNTVDINEVRKIKLNAEIYLKPI